MSAVLYIVLCRIEIIGCWIWESGGYEVKAYK
jgi:hypothetical protein